LTHPALPGDLCPFSSLPELLMTVRSWIRRVFARPVTSPIRKLPTRVRLGVEGLEDRTVPSTFLVTNTLGDDTVGSLRWAVEQANAHAGDDTIAFDQTVFQSPQTITLTGGELQVTDAVSVQGPGAGLLTVSGNNSGRVFEVNDGNSGTSLAVTISGLTVTDGSVGGNGGGIFNAENLTLVDAVVSGNVSGFFGGGIYNTGTATLTRSTVSRNSGYLGGGVANYGSGNLTVTGSTVSGNSADFGGGIYNVSNLTVTASTVSDNSSSFGGGGILTAFGTATVTGSTISDNSADDRGGGIDFTLGTLVVTNSTISGNTAASIGGGIYNGIGEMTLTDATVSGNTSAVAGGGIYIYGRPTPDFHAITTLRQVTVTDNAAPVGGGVYNGYSSTLILANSIIAGSTSGGDFAQTADPRVIQPILKGVNLVQDGSLTGANILNVDPKLGALADNGGPTLTQVPLAGSPVIDAGANDQVTTTVDQRGVFRVQGQHVDLGAVEVGSGGVPTGPLVVSTLADGVSPLGGPLTLREAVLLAESRGGDPTITFAPGVSGTIALTAGELDVTAAMNIAGPGAGKLTVNGENASRVFNVDDHDPTTSLAVKISGLTVTGGSVQRVNFIDPGIGGGISNAENLTLVDAVVTGNAALTPFNFFSGGGGGIANFGTLALTGATVSNNTTAGYIGGGGIYNAGTATLTRSTVAGNSSTSGGNGGGISNVGTLTLNGSTVSGNSTTGGGGGIENFIGQVTLNGSSVIGNTASGNGGGISDTFGRVTVTGSIVANNTTAGGSGGGISNDQGTVGVTGSIISGNSAINGGGIANRGTLTINSSTILNNRATSNGGGVRTLGGTVTITGTAILSNQVTSTGTAVGGGIESENTTLSLTNSTVSANRVDGTTADGGGIFTLNSTVDVQRSTVIGNRANGSVRGEGGGIFSSHTNLTLTDSTVKGNHASTDFDDIFSDT
jgi:hypothetical protein